MAGRGLVGRLVLLVLALALSELFAWVGLSLVQGAAFRPSAAQRQRLKLIAEPSPAAATVSQASSGPIPHPYVGYVLDPTVSRGPAFVEYHGFPVSSFGFIDAGPPLRERSPDTLLVGITGGSVAYFFSVHGVEVLARELEASPEYSGRRIVFVRLALGGYKQPQQLMTLQYLLALGAELDMLINLDGFNEIALYLADNGTRRVFPAFPRAWPELIEGAPGPESAYAIGKLAFYHSLRRRWAGAVSATRLDVSMLMNSAWLVGDVLLQRLENRARLAINSAEDSEISYRARGPEMAASSDDGILAQLTDIWRRSSIQLSRICRANDIDYFHFLQPNQYVLGSKPMGSEERSVAFSDDQPYRSAAERGYPLLRQAGETLTRDGVAYHDLTGLFADVEEPLYIDSCCHVNERGNEIIARFVARAILER